VIAITGDGGHILKVTRLAPENPDVIRSSMELERRVWGSTKHVACISSGLGFNAYTKFKPKPKPLSSYRKVFAEANGRPAAKGNLVHHIDGDRDNDDPSNLREMTYQDHSLLHGKQRRMGAARPCDVE